MEIQEKNRRGIPLWNIAFFFSPIPYCNSIRIPLKYAYLPYTQMLEFLRFNLCGTAILSSKIL